MLRMPSLRIFFNPRTFRVLRWSVASLLGLTGFAADWRSLTGNSPFGQFTASEPAAAPDELEFRGVVQEEGVYFVNLFNPTTKTSQWIPVQGKASGIEVGSYDAGTDKLQVIQAGRALTLPMKQARVTLVQAVVPPAAPNPENAPDGNRNDRADDGRGNRPGNGGDQSPMVRNLPPEAQALIQEFRRRRAERASGQQPQNAPRSRQPQPQQPQR
jgi:hypothetical protein